jgi:hypothetical protein
MLGAAVHGALTNGDRHVWSSAFALHAGSGMKQECYAGAQHSLTIVGV